MAEIIPSIFEKEFAAIEEKIALLPSHYTWVHIEFADQTLVPAQTFFDIPKFSELITKYTQLSFEAHVVVANPEKYLKSLVDAGFQRIIIHVESNDPRLVLAEGEKESIDIAVGLDSPTELEQIEPFLEEVDSALMMTVEAGSPGQPLLPEAVEKIKSVRGQFPDLVIAAEGGITPENLSLLEEAGASRLIINVDRVSSFSD